MRYITLLFILICSLSYGQYNRVEIKKPTKFEMERAFLEALNKPSGYSIIEKGELVNDKREGFWKFFMMEDPTQLICEGNYRAGLKDGDWTNYNWIFNIVIPRDSTRAKLMGTTPRSVEEWKSGLLYYWGRSGGMELIADSGINQSVYEKIFRIDETYSNFIMLHSVSYTSARLDIIDIATDCMLNLITENKISGKFTFSYANSGSSNEIKFVEGKEISAVTKNFHEGNLVGLTKSKFGVKTEQYSYIAGNPKDCDIKKFYANGNRKETSKIRNGVPDGNWTGYFENGKKKYSGSYRAGKKHGKWRMYTENGELKDEVKYKNGVKLD